MLQKNSKEKTFTVPFPGKTLLKLKTVQKLRVFTVDVLTWIALMYFIRKNNSILSQQIKTELWCIEVP